MKKLNCILLFCLSAVEAATLAHMSVQNAEGTFSYFAYGSNLLTSRIHVNNPTAKFMDTGKLNDHRLDFNIQSKYWNGAVATIVPEKNSTVEGVLWELDKRDLQSLDEQENWYFAKNVDITTNAHGIVNARTYQLRNNPEEAFDVTHFPCDRRPSKTYKEVIIRGAIEHNLSPEYIKFLTSIADNGATSNLTFLEDKYIRYNLDPPFSIFIDGKNRRADSL